MAGTQGPVISVHMLGEFSITINGNTITNLKGRTKRVWMLVEYLIAYRHTDVSLEKLMDILWEEDECGDPVNALKNLVYRADPFKGALRGRTGGVYPVCPGHLFLEQPISLHSGYRGNGRSLENSFPPGSFQRGTDRRV